MDTIYEAYKESVNPITEAKEIKITDPFLITASGPHKFEDAEILLKQFNKKIKYIEVSGKEDKNGNEYPIYSAIFYSGSKPKLKTLSWDELIIIGLD